jgi:hypothetical protein
MNGVLLALLVLTAPARAQAPQTLFQDGFAAQDGLITNAYGLWHSNDPAAALSPDWQVFSGSLFVREGVATTGVPDDTPPNAGSTNGTGSAKFRLLTARADFGDVELTFDLQNESLTTSNTTPANPWDGAHVMARYQSEKSHYYFSVNRRDETALIKKKVGEQYWDLTPAAPAGVPFGQWQKVKLKVVDNPAGSVSLWLWRDGRLLAQAVDRNAGGPPIRGGGRLGLRGDNARLRFGHFKVEAAAPAAAGGGAPPPPAAPKAPTVTSVRSVDVTTGSATIYWTTDQEALGAVDYGYTPTLGMEGLWSQGPLRGHMLTLVGLQPNTQYYYKVRAKTAAGGMGESTVQNFTTPRIADTTAPTVRVLNPTPGQTVSGTVPFSADAQDDVGVVGVQWELDNAPLGRETVSAPWAFFWVSGESFDGGHTIRAIARDAAGNRTVSSPIQITITGAKPRY